jgi:hypothetical protein
LCKSPFQFARPSDKECKVLRDELNKSIEKVNYEITISDSLDSFNKKRNIFLSGESFYVELNVKENGVPLDFSKVEEFCNYRYKNKKGVSKGGDNLDISIVGNSIICKHPALVEQGNYIFNVGYKKVDKSVSSAVVTFVNNDFYNEIDSNKKIEQNKGYGILNLVLSKDTKRYNLISKDKRGVLNFNIVSEWSGVNENIIREFNNFYYIAILLPMVFKELNCGKNFNIKKNVYDDDFYIYTVLTPKDLKDKKGVLNNIGMKIKSFENIPISCYYELDEDLVYGSEKDFTIVALSSYVYSIKKSYNVEVKDAMV